MSHTMSAGVDWKLLAVGVLGIGALLYFVNKGNTGADPLMTQYVPYGGGYSPAQTIVTPPPSDTYNYNFPGAPATVTGSPDAGALAALLALLGGGGGGAPADTTTTKKEVAVPTVTTPGASFTDALGNIWTEINPDEVFQASGGLSPVKKNTASSSYALTQGGILIDTQGMAVTKKDGAMTVNNLQGTGTEQKYSSQAGLDILNQMVAKNTVSSPATAVVIPSPVSTVTGFSDQYISTPGQPLQWNTSQGFGVTTNPSTGVSTPFSGPVIYGPGSTTPLPVTTPVDQRYGTYVSYSGITAAESKKADLVFANWNQTIAGGGTGVITPAPAPAPVAKKETVAPAPVVVPVVVPAPAPAPAPAPKSGGTFSLSNLGGGGNSSGGGFRW